MFPAKGTGQGAVEEKTLKIASGARGIYQIVLADKLWSGLYQMDHSFMGMEASL